MRRTLAIAFLFVPLASTGQIPEESPVKFALYSPSWGSNSGASLLSGMRLVIDNRTESPVQLESIEFQSDVEGIDTRLLEVDMQIPAGGFGEKELPYLDLLSMNQCVTNTLEANWRLVEISNYTLNPSVRRLIIQDTSAFRIYQCISTVKSNILDPTTGERTIKNEWVLYHFESRQE